MNKINNNKDIKRGDIYLVDLGYNEGTSMQSKVRACIIVSNNRANQYSPVIHVVPVTTKNKNKLPTHIKVGVDSGLQQESVAMAEQTVFVCKSSVLKKIGEVGSIILDKLDMALAIQFGLADKINKILEYQKNNLVRC